jgi:hypothetical protein
MRPDDNQANDDDRNRDRTASQSRAGPHLRSHRPCSFADPSTVAGDDSIIVYR